jgi:hypothetical protein
MNANPQAVEVQWLASSSNADLSWDSPGLSKFFSLQPLKRIMRQFEIPPALQVVPYLLTPRDNFHRLLSEQVAGAITKRTPYETGDMDKPRISGSKILSISAVLFPDGTLVSRIKALIILDQDGAQSAYEKLRQLRVAHNITTVDRTINHIINLLSGSAKSLALKHRYRSYFAMKLQVASELDTFPDRVRIDARPRTALLTGSPQPALTDYVIGNVDSANEGLNQKSRVENLVLNEQGLIYTVPSGPYAGPYDSRFDRTIDLVILGLAVTSFFDDSTGLSTRSTELSRFLGSRYRQWVTASETTFRESFLNRLTWERVQESFFLPHALSEWSQKTALNLSDQSPSPGDAWWTIPAFASFLDEAHESKQQEYDFIHDAGLRDFVQADRVEAERCRRSGNFRASIVMTGAAVEGVLLAVALGDRGEGERSALLGKNLSQLLEICCPKFRDGLKSDEAVPRRLISVQSAQLIYNALRPWRNFIHPGLALKDLVQVDELTALAATNAFDILLRELSH